MCLPSSGLWSYMLLPQRDTRYTLHTRAITVSVALLLSCCREAVVAVEPWLHGCRGFGVGLQTWRFCGRESVTLAVGLRVLQLRISPAQCLDMAVAGRRRGCRPLCTVDIELRCPSLWMCRCGCGTPPHYVWM